VSTPSKLHGHDEDERSLVAAARAGDAHAYGRLVDRHGGRLHAMLLHLANGDGDLAAEFTQEAFVRAWANLDRFAGDSAFYTWLYRLARNRALDLIARKRPRCVDLATLAPTAPGDAPLEVMAAGEHRDAVRAALAELAGDQRELLLLREFEGLDYQAIAERLDVPEGTVKSRLNRARAALRALLERSIRAEDLP
jgi:RNA polymerase sigma-70 factor, ECF subfamily